MNWSVPCLKSILGNILDNNLLMSEKIIIIGAGISGLSAGIFAQKNGYNTIIYEKNDIQHFRR